MTTNCGLLSLPDELLLHVLVHLENADIVQVRLVCRHLESRSIDEFGDRCFRHLLVTHYEQSVAKLQGIAGHPRLNRHVQNITINGRLPKGDTRHQSERCADWHQGLASAIQGFPNLEDFTIDNLPSAITGKVPGELSHREESCSCTFSVAIRVFQSLIVPDGPRFNLSISAHDARPCVHLFDPKAQSWKDNSACKVGSLTLVTCMEGDNTWEADLLYSLPNLQHFNVEGKLPDPTWAVLSWPTLNTIELNDLYLPSESFLAFIMRHNTTLSSVALTDVIISEGTWEDSLQKITNMNKLRHVHLLSLYQYDSSAEVSDSFKLNYPEMEQEVMLDDSDDIGIAAEVFRYHFWTTASEFTGDLRYLVDLRLIKAVVDGEIEYEHGQWKF